ncbi:MULTISPECIES: galactokinase [Clostridium]|uniref:Galactokinase n=2 Tax=Clostridium TaxID=1485 RepID=A0A151AKI3_9CLOT|nr:MULTISPECIES: galactokinase [Clostridium]KYH28128.1 galactokinase [Clostridium colicanis DSM 13634]MBE6043074.1 galactokinase [Clostridium thermopalmarium]PRR70542.1 Galactokinase [Clostridium thermopalmarium DSM 5974]PVZ21270.1 galactokinase [Clostridium thermopalmarium DSM 5974]
MNLENLIRDFSEVFKTDEGIHVFFAPGRVNLIGEHTDYNGGHVFPCAINFGTYAIARKREDSKVKVISKNFEELGVIEFNINDLVYREEDNWANYPKGIIKTFKDARYNIDSGLEILFFGNIPNGAGLSSSASIELATSIALKSLFNLNLLMIEMVELSQKSENQFNGVKCGIMDQFACGMGRKDHAILLDTNKMRYEYVPIKLDGISIVIANTNKHRDLMDSKYNERRSECENALRALQEKLEIFSLGDLSEEEFEENKHLIKNEIERKRAKHAVYENQRTIKAVRALTEGDIEKFGRLMNESHISLRDDYEVTGIELDTLVEAAWRNGAIGSRMTGAGFGGCTVSLVRNDEIESFIEKIGEEYERRIGYKADFYIVSIGDGARRI